MHVGRESLCVLRGSVCDFPLPGIIYFVWLFMTERNGVYDAYDVLLFVCLLSDCNLYRYICVQRLMFFLLLLLLLLLLFSIIHSARNV